MLDSVVFFGEIIVFYVNRVWRIFCREEQIEALVVDS